MYFQVSGDTDTIVVSSQFSFFAARLAPVHHTQLLFCAQVRSAP